MWTSTAAETTTPSSSWTRQGTIISKSFGGGCRGRARGAECFRDETAPHGSSMSSGLKGGPATSSIQQHQCPSPGSLLVTRRPLPACGIRMCTSTRSLVTHGHITVQGHRAGGLHLLEFQIGCWGASLRKPTTLNSLPGPPEAWRGPGRSHH